MENSKKFKNFTIIEEIDKGSIGMIYKIYCNKTFKFYALKIVNLFFNENKINIIKNEVTILKKLNHNNIIKIKNYEYNKDNILILMELMDCGNLKSFIKEFGPFKEKDIKYYIKNILNGLEYLHKNKIIHGDLKPGNILLDSDGNVKLSDFGSSFIIKNNKSIDINCNDLKGTIIYMPPEVLKQSNISRKSDIWSLGCIVLEMITGKSPWNELNFDNALSILLHIANNEIIPKYPDNISNNLKDFLDKCFIRNYILRSNSKNLLEHNFLKD